MVMAVVCVLCLPLVFLFKKGKHAPAHVMME
jgi:hypothetical protein